MQGLSASRQPADQFACWLRAARAGDADALGRLLESCRHYLELVAGRELANDLQAKVGASDLVQEAFLEAQQGFARFQGQTAGELAAWLERALLHNLTDCARHYRTVAKRRLDREVPLVPMGSDSVAEEDLPVDSLTPSKQAIAQEQEDRLLQALARLPDDYRQAILLRHQQGRSFEEVGRRLGRSPEAARKLWGRAVVLLQKELQQL
jgi:RNA polymerase sigma-70 factor (ECF subfamily)